MIPSKGFLMKGSRENRYCYSSSHGTGCILSAEDSINYPELSPQLSVPSQGMLSPLLTLRRIMRVQVGVEDLRIDFSNSAGRCSTSKTATQEKASGSIISVRSNSYEQYHHNPHGRQTQLFLLVGLQSL